MSSTPHDEALVVLLRHLPSDVVAVDGIWARTNMALLDPAQRAGWKLHLSATPSHYVSLLEQAVPALVAAQVPFKALRGIDEVERMNAGEYGLMQVGKCVTVYPRSEAHALELADALRTALHNAPGGPAVPTDAAFCEDAPIYFRYGPYDGRIVIDPMGQERRLLWREDLRHDTWDASTGGSLEGPEPALLPHAAMSDHLAFLRDEYAFESMLQLTAKGVVIVAKRAADGAKVLIKSARAGTNSDRHGRDAIWALKREHALLQSLAAVPGLPLAGVLCEAPGVAAIVRPFVEGDTFWALWTSPGARRADERRRLARTIDQLADTITCIHARGHVVRDVSAGNIVIAADRAYLTDLELAHGVDDAAPPYRRGTRGYFDPRTARDAVPTAQLDNYALQVLGAMIAEDPVPPSAYALSPKRASVDAAFCEAYFLAAFAKSIRPEAKPADANVYDGLAGLLLGARACGVALNKVADLQSSAHQIILAIPALRHIPGYHFGASGLAVALGVLAAHSAAPDDAGLRVLGAIDVAKSEVPDVCQGVAGHLLAGLALHALTGEDAALDIAATSGARLCAMVPWHWPQGPYGDLSGAACFGFAHGVAGVVYALLRLHAVQPSTPIEQAIQYGLRTLAAAARDVPGEDDALWWPVSATDATCWNAWCHGTPGVLKTLALARHMDLEEVPNSLIERALCGMDLANNSELCLCHGVASRVQAWNDCAALGIMPYGDAQRALAHDRDLLARALRAMDQPDGATPFADAHGAEASPFGLMTGATGALLALWRGEVAALGQDEVLLV